MLRRRLRRRMTPWKLQGTGLLAGIRHRLFPEGFWLGMIRCHGAYAYVFLQKLMEANMASRT